MLRPKPHVSHTSGGSAVRSGRFHLKPPILNGHGFLKRRVTCPNSLNSEFEVQLFAAFQHWCFFSFGVAGTYANRMPLCIVGLRESG